MASGRPTIYTDELAAEFCKRIASGKSARDVCSSSDMPNRSTIYEWCLSNTSFSAQYDLAKEERAEKIFEETLEIVDGVAEEAACVAKARLQMDARKWFLSKMLPKKYGDKPETGIEEQQDVTPVTVNINVKDASKDA